MGTLYRKVAVNDRLPEFGQRVIALVLEQNDLGLSKFLWNVSYSDITKSFKMDGNTVQIEYWLEEIPETIKSNNTETLANALHQIEKLEADKAELLEFMKELKYRFEYFNDKVSMSQIESLIQKNNQ